jgi:hypothetical protein
MLFVYINLPLLNCPEKHFGCGMWIICHSLSNDFWEISEHKTILKPKIFLPGLEILKNHVQFLLLPNLKKSKSRMY